MFDIAVLAALPFVAGWGGEQLLHRYKEGRKARVACTPLGSGVPAGPVGYEGQATEEFDVTLAWT